MQNFVKNNAMTCFRVVKSILDETYGEPDPKNDIEVQSGLKDLHRDYQQLREGIIPSYNTHYKCFAYLYCYVPAHANIIYRLVNDTPALHKAFNAEKMKISCLGGGPCSDLLGIQKFIAVNDKATTLYYDIYDSQALWRQFWDSTRHNVRSTFKAPSSKAFSLFRTFDATNQNTWLNYRDLWDTDLFTMSFFLSEVYPRREQANFFESMFRQAKLGSLFLFVDNISVRAEDWFDKLIKTYNGLQEDDYINIIRKSRGSEELKLEQNERKEDLAPYYGRYLNSWDEPWSPRLNAEIVFRVCQKVSK